MSAFADLNNQGGFMKKFIVAILLVALVTTGISFAGSTDVFLSIPMSIDQFKGDNPGHYSGTGLGPGVRYSTAGRDDAIGFNAGLTVFFPIAVSFSQENGINTTKVDELYSFPVGLDFALGVDLNFLKFGFIEIPISVGAHSKLDFYKDGPLADFGVGVNTGIQLALGGFGVFARAQVAYDFYRVGYSDVINVGKLNQWSVQPQIGVSFRGK